MLLTNNDDCYHTKIERKINSHIEWDEAKNMRNWNTDETFIKAGLS